MPALLQEILAISLAAAPWLVLGLVIAGLVKAFLPEALLRNWIGGRGFGAIGRAAIIGAPLPLCSCGAIPTALTLYRGGAGRGPTTAFMVSTPGIGGDSVALTYALLGPVMMVARVLGAIVAAVGTGLLVAGSRGGLRQDQAAEQSSCAPTGCGSGCGAPAEKGSHKGMGARLRDGMAYAFTDLFDDIGGLMALGLVLAGVILWAVPPQAVAAHAGGLPAMLLMAVVGIPIYLCATAATPIAAALLVAGVSPGAVLVFLLAGPITSMATLAVLRREMGNAALVRYLGGIVATTVLIGLMFDGIAGWMDLEIVTALHTGGDLLPAWAGWSALTLLVILGLRPVRRGLIRAVQACRGTAVGHRLTSR